MELAFRKKLFDTVDEDKALVNKTGEENKNGSPAGRPNDLNAKTLPANDY